MKKCSLLLLGILALLVACDEEPPVSADMRLIEAINSVAGIDGNSEFIFPDSDDFTNIPQDPLNPLSPAKVQLGKLLFHETALAIDGNFTETTNTYSCASCHHAQGGFQANLPQGIGDGGMGFGMNGEGRTFNPLIVKEDIDVQPIRTPTALNSAFQTNMLWNGQFGATGVNVGTESVWPDEGPISTNNLGYEGLEIQAIAGLSVHRFGLSISEDFITGTEYKELFDVAFFDLPEEERYNKETAGLAIAAYERTLFAHEAPFQQWLKGDFNAMTEDQTQGAVIFFRENCVSCHNGPALASMTFHGFGFNDLFNGSYGTGEVINVADDNPAALGRGSFTKDPADNYKFKTPQLYNLKDSKFFGHGSSFTDLEALIRYKTSGVSENPVVPSSQLSSQFTNRNLTDREIEQLADFIENALYDPNLLRYVPTALPSGNCFPNNDALSRVDLECL